MIALTILGAFGLGGLASGIIGVLVIIILALLVVQIFYLLTLQKAMQQVSPDLRKMEPGLVWLMFIPLFRSEEHTSELQSLMRISYAVFCLTKKKSHTYN